MNKVYFVLIVLFITLFFYQYSYADESQEISLNQLFIEYNKIMLPSNRSSIDAWKEISVALDYGIEIIKRAPESLEAYCVISSINSSINWKNDPRFIVKRKDWDNKRLNNLNIPDETTPEDIVFLRVSFFDSTDKTKKGPENPQKLNICRSHLEKMMNECNNKNFAALANSCLLFITSKDYFPEFIKRFPNHKTIPIIKLGIAIKNRGENNDTAIIEINKVLNEYKNVMMPEGWTFEMHCYQSLALTYVAMKDFEKAKHYYDLIEKNAPNYHWLNDLKETISRGGKSIDELINEIEPLDD